MKQLFFILSLFVSLGMNAQVQTDSTVRAKILLNIPDNNTRSITPSLMRSSLNTMMDYIQKYTELMMVGTNGKSFSIKPKGVGNGLGTPPAAVAKELYMPFVAHMEDSLKTKDLYGRLVNVVWKGKQVYSQNIIVTPQSTEIEVIDNIEELIEWNIESRFLNVSNVLKTQANNTSIRYDPVSHTIFAKDYECGSCTNRQILLTITYIKQ